MVHSGRDQGKVGSCQPEEEMQALNVAHMPPPMYTCSHMHTHASHAHTGSHVSDSCFSMGLEQEWSPAQGGEGVHAESLARTQPPPLAPFGTPDPAGVHPPHPPAQPCSPWNSLRLGALTQGLGTFLKSEHPSGHSSAACDLA